MLYLAVITVLVEIASLLVGLINKKEKIIIINNYYFINWQKKKPTRRSKRNK